jgi:uncharacterized protein YggE
MHKFIALIALGTLVIQLRAEPELKGSSAELATYLASVPKTVSIVGESEVKVTADRALIALKVVTENKSLQEANRANQEIRAKIIKTLGEHGIPADRVKPSKFSSTPKYGVFKEKAKSYLIENIVRITAQDEKEFQAVSSLVDTMSEVRYDSVEFESADKEGLKNRALAEAIDKAGQKKKLYEEKLGVKLSPKQFNEAVTVPTPLPLSRGYYGKASNSYSSGVAALKSVEFADAEAEMPNSFEELIYRARITVEYALETK